MATIARSAPSWIGWPAALKRLARHGCHRQGVPRHRLYRLRAADHGRMIWGEQVKAGYGLYDRALGAVYLNGLWEAIDKFASQPAA